MPKTTTNTPSVFTAQQLAAAKSVIAKLPKRSTAHRAPMSKEERSVLQTAAGYAAAARRVAADTTTPDAQRNTMIAERIAHANQIYAVLNRPPLKASDFPLAKSGKAAKKAS